LVLEFAEQTFGDRLPDVAAAPDGDACSAAACLTVNGSMRCTTRIVTVVTIFENEEMHFSHLLPIFSALHDQAMSNSFHS
jgi:hypothetical protein